jgi:hypothetical protein|tara:strand:+ start:4741 stop:5088 length:348 start_codon:yes stop_codon:yes gene_type:complete
VELQFLVDLLLVLEIHADSDLADIQEELVEEPVHTDDAPLVAEVLSSGSGTLITVFLRIKPRPGIPRVLVDGNCVERQSEASGRGAEKCFPAISFGASSGTKAHVIWIEAGFESR